VQALFPARFLSGDFVEGNIPTFGVAPRGQGFAIFNTALVAFGLWCFFGPIRRNRPPGRAFAWFWVALELFNGAAHIAWATLAGGYRPGLATAPVLVVASLVLAWSLRRGAEPAAPSG
jgi:hypothetical protein